ncbi:DNA helicase INO80 isoform X1 [Selaginella moellendorffii]|uniref:DNA helicase INO80 isoform X1 n=1 Tax=Selaginella moellendorffii TaxID=88036 RepID=UPI000D1C802F|nr:DNA helicase INO80 isoform X1 [Selaginella moellendorffii]|eukprot:XP_024521051.1 DNA helicase INO80 isoform X1 [Selaginella moellendorffii]
MTMPASSQNGTEEWELKGCSYSVDDLFNLEPLLNFHIPEELDDFASLEEQEDEGSSRLRLEEERAEIPLSSQAEMTLKRKRVQVEAEAGSAALCRDDADSNDDNCVQISEEHYRGLLGEHLQKYRRTCLKEAIAARLTSNAVGRCLDTAGVVAVAGSSQADSSVLQDERLLDLGEGLKFLVPPFYEQLAQSIELPSMASIQVEESVLSGPVTSKSVAAIIASDRRLGKEPVPLVVVKHKTGTSRTKFPLRVLDAEKATRLINGYEMPVTKQGTEKQLPVNDIKVLDRGDGYEVIQRRIQRKPATTKNATEIAHEDVEKVAKFWVSLVKRDLPKHFKAFTTYHKKQMAECKRLTDACQKEVKLRNTKIMRAMKNAPIRNRKLARDMINFWRKLDKEQAEVRRREEKDAAEALKRDEEFREARRQQQRLNFLLTQTELYSHFMQNKLTGQKASLELETDPAGSKGPVDAAEEAALREEALRAAEKAAFEQKEKTNMFDNECSKLREVGPGEEARGHGENIDLLHPSTMPTTSSVDQPSLFHGNLKEYQLKGLQWLVNCYEQGLNGILADEMGLGKTIQAMAFLAHLAEEKNIWGPFLVVAPSTVLNNWADEIKRFCPELKILPYWGGLQERTVLRKNINPKRLYRRSVYQNSCPRRNSWSFGRDSSFHILITSYQLLVSDEKYFKRVKWQYLVLDEAQAIKSASSLRWKILLSFSCRNRLLLTGTPIQNNMAELWALLHFIMPTLFDSHEQFNEWFSKGIENHAEHGGTLNEHQLNRLHAILKPFMLRRVKKDVVSELTKKKEVVVPCLLSSRQQAIYQAVKNKISIADLFDGGHLNEKKVVNLMNIVIQLRKVCNHPELFERNEGRTYFHFAASVNHLLPAAFGDLEDLYCFGNHNPIAFKIPKLIYRDGITSLRSSAQGFQEKWLFNLMNVFSAENVHKSAVSFGQSSSGSFGFTRLMNTSSSEVSFLSNATILERCQYGVLQSRTALPDDDDDSDPRVTAIKRLLLVRTPSESGLLRRKRAVGLTLEPFEALAVPLEERLTGNTQLLRSVKAFIPPVLAPQIEELCSDRSFAYQRAEELHNPYIKRLLVGFGRTSEFNGPSMPLDPHPLIQEIDKEVHGQNCLLTSSFQIFGSAPPLQTIDFARTLMDSGKLQALDILFRRLRAEEHRVLVFAQMTKMLNILEDYMKYRKYKYLRLDGSSTIMDRRDMVKDFQHRSDIFVFLLSTRAGGLGINLTAADTVIFYESDWNPTMDLQAMDRAHRLGQTKEVTVYRLICKGTVEEKIVKRANQKNTVQQLVMTGGQSQDVFEADEVVSLLLDDAELEQRLKHQKSLEQTDKPRGKKNEVSRKVVQIDADEVVSLQDDLAAGAGDSEKLPEKATPSRRKSGQKRQAGDEMKPPKPSKVAKETPTSDAAKEAKPRSKAKPKKASQDVEKKVAATSATR